MLRQTDHFGDDRGEVSLALVEIMTLVDEANTARLKEMLQNIDWFRDDRDGPLAAWNGWLLLQHADRDADFQREMLPRVKAALSKPGVDPTHYAYLYDRVAGKDEKPQRYGTQGSCGDDGVWAPKALEDTENIDAIRAEVGLGPIADYIDRFKSICPPASR